MVCRPSLPVAILHRQIFDLAEEIEWRMATDRAAIRYDRNAMQSAKQQFDRLRAEPEQIERLIGY